MECVSALHRLCRERHPSERQTREALGPTRGGRAPRWIEIRPTERLRQRAMRRLGIHPLRAADALRLAAALAAADEAPHTLDFVLSDARLSDAAVSEGFEVR